MNKVQKKIKCKNTLWLVKQIIDSRQSNIVIEYFDGDDLFTPLYRKKGLPVGNLTSQFFANLYLNDFDHFIKEELAVRFYVRYCDDFVIFGNSRTWLNEIKCEIKKYLETLRLRLHENKSRVFRTTDGVDFLGYRIYPDYVRVRKSIVKRYRRKLRQMAEEYKSKNIGIPEINNSIQSWIGHVKHADSYQLRKEIFRNTVFTKTLN